MASVNGNGRHVDVDERPFRKPPHNTDAEKSVLGAMLIDNEVIPRVLEQISANDFYHDTHQIIMRAIQALYDKGLPVDGVTLADELIRREQLELIDGDETLEELVSSVPHSANAEYHAQIIRQKSMARALLERGTDLINGIFSGTKTADELLAEAHESLGAIGTPAEVDSHRDAHRRPWPEEPAAAVWHGLAGDIVFKIAPHTEADPIAILGQLLVAFGNLIGRKAHWRVEASRHACNLFLCVVGNSAKARKGTSWDIVRWLLRACDPDWSANRILGGLSSGEGMIWSVRDPIVRREKQGTLGFQDVMADPGIDDKRALFVESEFGSTLAVLNREGNSLSGYLRKAWDSGDLSSVVKNNPAKTSGAHISVIAHITNDELYRRLTQTEAANGFANRFLWLCAKRSRYLPEGGQINKVDFTAEFIRLNEAVEFAKGDFEKDDSFVLVRDDQARKLWCEVYPIMTEPKPGLLGSVTSRAEAQVMRIASIYALLDRTSVISRPHLEAALALWRYCEQSAAYCFGDSMGVPNADKVLAALEAAPDEGVSKRDIVRKVFNGHDPKEPRGGVEEILDSLHRAGLAEFAQVATKGRPTIRWKRTANHLVNDQATKAPKAPKGSADDASHVD